MSEAISGITGGKYRQVVLDKNFQIYLDTEETCLELHQVSYGTAEQVYLSLRMACRGNFMPGGGTSSGAGRDFRHVRS